MTALVLVCGSYSTAAAWQPAAAHLPGDWQVRIVVLPGHGGTDDPRSRDNPDMMLQANAIAEAADALGGAVHVAAHSYGGTVALAAICAGRVEALSFTGFEANPIDLLRQSGRGALYDRARAFADRFIAAHDSGDPDAAGMVIDFWGRDGSWAAMPPHIQEFCRQGAEANALDWMGAFCPLDGLDACRQPFLVARGEHANDVARGVTDAFCELLPQARQATVEGADHFLITTHPAECAGLIRANIDRA